MLFIFDLDQTLVDSNKASGLRKNRQWSKVYSMIPELMPFCGVNDFLSTLNRRGAEIAIVTSSPRPYCERIISYWGWTINITVCYHDTRKHKPDPEPILLALQKSRCSAEKTFAVGDTPGDIIAANRAGVLSVAALWRSDQWDELLAANPGVVCQTVSDLCFLI